MQCSIDILEKGNRGGVDLGDNRSVGVGAAGRDMGKGNCSFSVTYKRRIIFFKKTKIKKEKNNP